MTYKRLLKDLGYVLRTDGLMGIEVDPLTLSDHLSLVYDGARTYHALEALIAARLQATISKERGKKNKKALRYAAVRG